jgi:hypothetical protein
MSVKHDWTPDHIWKAAMHYHDLIYIKAYWESIGQSVPNVFAKELERAHSAFIHLLTEEEGQGGAYHEWDKKIERRIT